MLNNTRSTARGRYSTSYLSHGAKCRSVFCTALISAGDNFDLWPCRFGHERALALAPGMEEGFCSSPCSCAEPSRGTRQSRRTAREGRVRVVHRLSSNKLLERDEKMKPPENEQTRTGRLSGRQTVGLMQMSSESEQVPGPQAGARCPTGLGGAWGKDQHLAKMGHSHLK